jgi:hypothetical protein
MKLYDVLKVKIALVNSVFYITEYPSPMSEFHVEVLEVLLL